MATGTEFFAFAWQCLAMALRCVGSGLLGGWFHKDLGSGIQVPVTYFDPHVLLMLQLIARTLSPSKPKPVMKLGQNAPSICSEYSDKCAKSFAFAQTSLEGESICNVLRPMFGCKTCPIRKGPPKRGNMKRCWNYKSRQKARKQGKEKK